MGCCLHDTGKKKKGGHKLKVAGKSSQGHLSDEAVDAMLDGQQHMLGELNQVILHLSACFCTKANCRVDNLSLFG